MHGGEAGGDELGHWSRRVSQDTWAPCMVLGVAFPLGDTTKAGTPSSLPTMQRYPNTTSHLGWGVLTRDPQSLTCP